MSPSDLIDDLRSRINPVYSAQVGTESYERRICAETIEWLLSQREELIAELSKAAEYHRSHECYSEATRLDKYIASVKG